MILIRNRKGQAMVESTCTLTLLFLFFTCIYFLFMMAMDKIRSLDTVYHLARAHQVQSDTAWPVISARCFGRLGLGTPKVTHRSGGGTPIDEVEFQFLPHTLLSQISLGHSTMRVPRPDRTYFNFSYRGARADLPEGVPALLQETLVVEGKAHARIDARLRPIEDMEAAVEAGHS